MNSLCATIDTGYLIGSGRKRQKSERPVLPVLQNGHFYLHDEYVEDSCHEVAR